MHRTRLAKKAGTETREHLACRKQYAPEAVGIAGIVSRVPGVLLEGNAVGNLARHGHDVDFYAEFAQRNHHIFVEFGDAHRLEHKLPEISFARPYPQHMIDEIQIDLKAAVAPRDWRRRQSARSHIKRHMP